MSFQIRIQKIRASLKLRSAVQRYDTKAMRAALVLGANPDFAIWQAFHGKNDKILGLLLEAGANPESRNSQGHTLLHQAIVERRAQTFKYLLNFKAYPNELKVNPSANTTFENYPALWLAILNDSIGMCQKLIDTGANPYHQGGKFPTTHYSDRDSFGLVEILFDTIPKKKQRYMDVLKSTKCSSEISGDSLPPGPRVSKGILSSCFLASLFSGSRKKQPDQGPAAGPEL